MKKLRNAKKCIGTRNGGCSRSSSIQVREEAGRRMKQAATKEKENTETRKSKRIKRSVEVRNVTVETREQLRLKR